MNKILAAALLCAVPFAAHAANYSIEHMDPPLWWTGMHNSKLQLMVHGPAIAELEPALAYPGVRIASVARVANKNYLFIDLEIAPDAAPGRMDLVFQRVGQAVHYNYPLLARAAGSAQRVGFNSSDAASANPTFGRYTTAYDPRRLQMAAKFQF